MGVIRFTLKSELSECLEQLAKEKQLSIDSFCQTFIIEQFSDKCRKKKVIEEAKKLINVHAR